jgi:gentisate 1,2-dioxygenase
MFTAYVELLPGESVHPPHRHAEEEFLFIINGTGVWTVYGKEEFAAKSGDLLYASPWKWHGVQNTGTDTMTFFFLKWNNKGVAPPAEPEGAHIQ